MRKNHADSAQLEGANDYQDETRGTLHEDGSKGATDVRSFDVILLAARDMTLAGRAEFSLPHLAVVSWMRAPHRFGLRGFEIAYPDIQCVSAELTEQRYQWLEKTRPDYYRLTALGLTRASELGNPKCEIAMVHGERLAESWCNVALGHHEQAIRAAPLSDVARNAITRYAGHRVFRQWLANPEQPSTWADVGAFFEFSVPPIEFSRRTERVLQHICAAITWCREHGRGGIVGSVGIVTIIQLEKLRQFIQHLRERFSG
ncbi:hypothetical protein [Pendulispora albinea]|uniref:Uncharacterized protein n=1 Tax=Pendulispora albinea TaxID=2741071 RepID=A0ABZ2M868_9BACT